MVERAVEEEEAGSVIARLLGPAAAALSPSGGGVALPFESRGVMMTVGRTGVSRLFVRVLNQFSLSACAS